MYEASVWFVSGLSYKAHRAHEPLNPSAANESNQPAERAQAQPKNLISKTRFTTQARTGRLARLA